MASRARNKGESFAEYRLALKLESVHNHKALQGAYAYSLLDHVTLSRMIDGIKTPVKFAPYVKAVS